MTEPQPRYESQSINFVGFITKQLGDLRGPSSLAYELIQNADDAKDDSLQLSATRIEFDVTDDALIVTNDAVFRNEDFERIRDLASGTKQLEGGNRTTGAFGVGFISVYQVTDRPQIYSAGQHWTLRPEKPESKRIKIYDDPSSTIDKGTKFYLPWANKKSELREKLKSPPVTNEYIELFIEELKISLPKAILFLKNLKKITLLSNGKVVIQIRRIIKKGRLVVHWGDERQQLAILCDIDGLSAFKNESAKVYDNRLTKVRVAIPDGFIDNGILFATLPTEQPTGLPFFIDADFFPASDRKTIVFEDAHDYRSEWNREVLQVAASLVRDNLAPLRDIFDYNPYTFWAIIERIYDKSRDTELDARMPLGVFWETLEPVLKTYPIVYTESKQWLKPIEVRIPGSEEEWNTIDAFKFLDIEMVHRDLRRYRNILRRIGVTQLRVEDIYEAFEERELIAHPQPLSFYYMSYEQLRSLWQGILAVYNRTSSKKAKNLLKRCVLAPGVDKRIWPFDSVYKAEDDDTLKIFSNLLPDTCSFLDLEQAKGENLFEYLVPSFSLADAIKVLEMLKPKEFNKRLDRAGFKSKNIIRWFSDRQIEMEESHKKRLIKLAIFPAGDGSTTSLEDLWMPGGFDDPLGITQLLDMQKLDGLSDFLTGLGAKKLTFIDYAKRHIIEAFDSNSLIDSKIKDELLQMLEKYIGEIRDDAKLKDELAQTSIVECSDEVFRSPKVVYFPDKEIEKVLGNHVSYCKLPAKSENGRRDLYKWLGVAEHPRVEDILLVIDRLTNDSPDHRNSKAVIRCLKAVAKSWEDFSDDERKSLKNKRWLPASNSSGRWYRPDELYTADNKRLFESQACFLDAPIRIQNELSAVLPNLGIKSQPQPSQVARHLLECSRGEIVPPKGIYEWLDKKVEEIPSRVLDDLRVSTCLYLGHKYRHPDQVFWQHNFGRFRSQLVDDMRYYSNLLRTLGVKENPDHDDALKLLKDIANEKSNNRLEPEEKDAVFQCWVLISRALDQDNLTDNEIKKYLRDIPCIPDVRGVLIKPSWMFFEDRPRFKDKFKLPANNCIQRTERIWKGMEAAGVRPLSSAILGDMDKEDIDIGEDTPMRDTFTQRRNLIATILEGYVDYNGNSLIDEIRFFWADEIKVTWKLYAFNRCEESIDVESAYFDYEEKAIYYTLDHINNTPWSAIARELSYALVRGDRVVSISPGIKVCLEATTYDEARMELEVLGIALTQELALEESSGQTNGVTFGEMLEDEATDGDRQEDSLEEDDTGDGVTDSDTSKSVSGVSRGAHIGEKFYGRPQGTKPPGAVDHPVSLPPVGPLTEESADEDTYISAESGSGGAYIERLSTRWEPTEAAVALAHKFRDMVHGDYGKRCQICGSTFSTTSGQLQVYVVHVVPPSEDRLANHFGNLLGLCGWHFSLIRFNHYRKFLDRRKQPFDDWEHMRDYVLKAEPDVDDEGNSYFSLGIRFPNVYPLWSSEPTPEDAVIRYSEPHWKYLRKLLSS